MKFLLSFLMLVLCVSLNAQATFAIVDNDLKITNRSNVSIRYPITDIKYKISETDSTVNLSSSTGLSLNLKTGTITITGRTTAAQKMSWFSENLKGVNAISQNASQQLTSIGTVAPVTTSVTSSQTLTTTDAISIMIENIGGAVGTINEGGVSFSLAAGVSYTYDRVLDKSTNKYSPFPTIAVNGTGTTIKVTIYKIQ